MPSIVVFGPGWLGHKYKDYFNAYLSSVDIADARAVATVLEDTKPDIVINTAGKTGRPNVDWCEDHKEETVYSNITGPLVLSAQCLDRGIRFVHLSSGCIFSGKAPGDKGFTEEDEPNPPSFYSWTKATADSILRQFPILILRLRMPLDHLPSERNLLTKLLKYEEVVDTENSVTVVNDLLFATKHLIDEKQTGIYNIVNPGGIKHSEILKIYKEEVDPHHRYVSLTLEEFENKHLTKAKRSNCVLSTDKLESTGLVLPSVYDRLSDIMKSYGEKK